MVGRRKKDKKWEKKKATEREKKNISMKKIKLSESKRKRTKQRLKILFSEGRRWPTFWNNGEKYVIVELKTN